MLPPATRLAPVRRPAPAAPAAPALPGVLGLGRHGERPAVVTEDGAVLTHAELADRAARLAHRLGTTPRLVAVAARPDLATVVAILACLEHHHPLLLLPGDRPDVVARARATHDPDVVLSAGHLEEVRPGTAHDLHPDLALLLSTSGSTGSPKLARLSRRGVAANAAQIAAVLGLADDDRAVTSLPLHYCYGLSLLTSHLLVGGSLALTDHSVLDPGFWDLCERAEVTTLAGVPHTFELLDRAGLADRDLPALRRLTQAGGRLHPDRVRHHARAARERGRELFVMYGQTEATARMAVLPPELAEHHPDAVGVAVPGGSFRLEPLPAGERPDLPADAGELVYAGPNVMMGYAHGPADLARGAELEELRTGDLAVVRDGLVHVLGRRDRVAKLFGLRIDLDHLETLLSSSRAAGSDEAVVCLAADDRLEVVTTRRGRASDLAAAAREATGLPGHAVRASRVEALPRTASGKVDRAALAARLDRRDAAHAGAPLALADELALVLGLDAVDPGRSLVEQGCDSLSYVELSVRLARRLGDLPADWHRRPVRELLAADAAASPARRARLVRVETSVLLRAAALVLIVASHADLIAWMGGAHVLLAVAGYNLARFVVDDRDRVARVHGAALAALRIAVPTALVVLAVAATTHQYRWPTALALNGVLGSNGWTDDWQLWFVEALVWLCLGSAALLAVPALDAAERRRPFAVALAAVVALLALRYAWTGVEAGPTERYTVGVIAWCFALGWAAARADGVRQRVVVSAVALVGTLGFFGDLHRELTVVAGIALLTWVRSVRLPAPVVSAAAVLASSSLAVYLTHWQVYPHLEDRTPLGATLASLAVGVVVGRAAARGWAAARRSTARARVGRVRQPIGWPKLPRW